MEAAGRGTRGAHLKHLVHGCDAGGIPARYVCVELVQVIEEIGHVCDCRDAPARYGAVRRSGGSRVGVVLLGRRPQGGRVREGIGRWRRRRRARAQAAPIRTVPIVKLGAARPCAPDEDLVCVGQTICSLPSRNEGIGRGWRARQGDGMAWGGRGASSAQGEPNCGGWGQGTRGAHVKHFIHVCDAGGVETQRLVES